jgi:hypothetical protein
MKKLLYFKMVPVGAKEGIFVDAIVFGEDGEETGNILARQVTEIVREDTPLLIRYLINFVVVEKNDLSEILSSEKKVDGRFFSSRIPDDVQSWEMALGRKDMFDIMLENTRVCSGSRK